MVERLAVDMVHLDGSAVLMVRGDIDMASAAAFRAALEQAMSSGVPVVVDFAGVTFMDSSGLKVILGAHKATGDAGSVCVRNPSPQVRRVFTMTGLSDMLTLDTGAVTDPAEREPGAVTDDTRN